MHAGGRDAGGVQGNVRVRTARTRFGGCTDGVEKEEGGPSREGCRLPPLRQRPQSFAGKVLEATARPAVRAKSFVGGRKTDGKDPTAQDINAFR
jgi:hypothetical protein